MYVTHEHEHEHELHEKIVCNTRTRTRKTRKTRKKSCFTHEQKHEKHEKNRVEKLFILDYEKYFASEINLIFT